MLDPPKDPNPSSFSVLAFVYSCLTVLGLGRL